MKEDLSVAFRGGVGGGGSSWIHPIIAVHFLNWCCPEFALDVIQVFFRSLDNDVSIRSGAHQEQLNALQGDLEKQQELVAKYNLELAAKSDACQQTLVAIEEERHKNSKVHAKLHEEITALKADVEGYKAYLKAQQERQAELEAKMEVDEKTHAAEKDDLEAANQGLQSSLDFDTTRPVNVLRGVSDPMAAERHRVPHMHYYAKFVCTTIGVCIAQKAYEIFVSEVTKRMSGFVNKEYALKKLYQDLHNPRRFKAARGRVLGWFTDMLPGSRKVVSKRVKSQVLAALDMIFNDSAIEFADNLSECQMCNPVHMQIVAHKLMKAGMDVDYSTEVTVKRMTEIAERSNATMKSLNMPIYMVIAEDVKGF